MRLLLIPEHFHAFIWSKRQANPSPLVQKPEDHAGLFFLKNLPESLGYPWC
jgi:hypothetical protein